MPPLFFIFLNVYFGKPKLQTWKIETAGLSVVTVGEGMPGCWQGLPVTLRQGIKMRGWLEEGPLWALSGKQNTFSLETRFSGIPGKSFLVNECSRKNIGQGVRSLRLHLWPWSRLFLSLSPSLFISKMEGGQNISEMGNWFQFFYWLVVAGAGQG